MSESMRSFEPIYGWGWHRGETAVVVPDPFQLVLSEISRDSLVGVVQSPHLYAGFNAALSLRSRSEGVAQWNVRLTSASSAEPVTGFAQSAGQLWAQENSATLA